MQELNGIQLAAIVTGFGLVAIDLHMLWRRIPKTKFGLCSRNDTK